MQATSRTVVVTGASAGAGRAIAQHFGSRGWRVGLVARNVERLEAARREIEDSGGSALVLPADTGDAQAVFAARDKAMAAWGSIGVWVNAAMSTVVSPIARMTPEEYRRVTEVTYLGYVHGTLAALEVMRASDRGTIVQVGSALAYRAIPLQSAYCAAKFAVRGFTDSLRTELLYQRSRVRVTMVQLPGMNTPQFDWARNKFATKYQPVGTVYQPEVAAAAVYRAALHAPRELWVGGSAIQAILGQLVAPGVMDRILARSAWSGQVTETPEAPQRRDNLEESVPGPYGVHGRFDSRAQPKALVVNPQHLRLGVLALAAALASRLVTRATARNKQLKRAART
ncbi:MAG: SDR family oxidoreductase [Pseudomonadota bacterium]|nr:SDR family oxidoreductase [Pseudomonadota bacterium]